MKLLPRHKCEYPFYGEYCLYLDTHKNRMCVRIFLDGKRSTMHYARYLMSVKLGRLLDPEIEHVHHSDGNQLNDDIANLELIDIKDHARIHNPPSRKTVQINCSFCGISFIRLKKDYNVNLKRGSPVFCSRSCKAARSNQQRIYKVTV